MIVGVLTPFIHKTLEIGAHVFFNLIEQHSKFLLHTLQVLYMCTLGDSANIDTIIEFVPHVRGDGDGHLGSSLKVYKGARFID